MSTIEAHFGSVLATARNARNLYPMNGHVPLQVLHNSQEIPINAHDFLHRANIDESVLKAYMDENGIWAYEQSPSVNITGLSADDTYRSLEEHASPLLDMSMRSLLEAHKYSIPHTDVKIGLFNDHTYRNHIYHAHRMVQQYLQLAGVTDPQALADAAAMTALHDTFNFLSRGIHNLLGARGVKRMFPNLTGGDKQRMRNIQYGIMLHNEPIYQAGPLKLKGLPFREKVEKMRVWHTPMSAALLLADKAEIRRGRVIPQALRPEIVDVHSHTRGNLYTDYQGLTYTDEVIEMNLDYDPLVHREDLQYTELADGWINHDFAHIYAPSHLKDDTGHLSMEKAYNEMWGLYGPKEHYDADRFTLMLAAGFVLCPDATTFRVNYVNKYDQSQAILHEFTLNDADDIFAEFIQSQ